MHKALGLIPLLPKGKKKILPPQCEHGFCWPYGPRQQLTLTYYPLFTHQETCQYLKNYLTQLLVPYVVNVSWATQYCSRDQCNGHGRCVRRNPSANTFLHLSASSFRLVPGRAPGEPQLRPEGELSRADLNYLQTHFRCQCYLGWGGEQCQWDHRRAAGGASGAWTGSHFTSLLALVAVALT